MISKVAPQSPIAVLENFGLGSFPSGWGILCMDDLLSGDRGVSVGVMYPGEHVDSGVPLLKVADLAGSKLPSRPSFRISREIHYKYRRTELEGGELLLTLVGGLGQVAVVPPDMAGWNAARAIAVIRLKDPSDAGYVRIALLSAPLQRVMHAWANTTVQATLNLKEVRQLPLPWPPRRERDGIARVIGHLEEKIELNRQTNEMLEQIARGLFRSWFIDFDPVRAKMEGRSPANMDSMMAAIFPNTFDTMDAVTLPSGWQMQAFDQSVSFLNGLALQKFVASESEDSLPVIKITQIRAGHSESAERANLSVPMTHRIDDGDLVFSWSGTLLVRLWVGGLGALNQHLFKVTSALLPRWFIHGWLLHHLPTFQTIAADKATTMGHIQRHHLTEAQIVVPPPQLLEKTGTVLASLEAQFISNEKENRSLRTLRDELLPRLLSGELRVRDAEREVKAHV